MVENLSQELRETSTLLQQQCSEREELGKEASSIKKDLIAAQQKSSKQETEVL